jgi:hypothetical protein
MTQVTITHKELYGILGISLDGSYNFKIEAQLLKALIAMKEERDVGEDEIKLKRAQDSDLITQLLPLNGKSELPDLPKDYIMKSAHSRPPGISQDMDVFLQKVQTYKIQFREDIQNTTDIRNVLAEEFYFVKSEIEEKLGISQTTINNAVKRKNSTLGIRLYGVRVSTTQQNPIVSSRAIWFINLECFSMMFNSVRRTGINLSLYNPKYHDDFEQHKDNDTPLPIIHNVMVKRKRKEV